jgi:agmatinase
MDVQDFDPNSRASTGSGIFGLPYGPEEGVVVLIPVPWEVTTSYRPGTASGPRAILAASRQVDLFDGETGQPYVAGIAMVEESVEVQSWNRKGRMAAELVMAEPTKHASPASRDALVTVNDLGACLNRWVQAEAQRWLEAGKLVGVVGGDHSVALGLVQAMAARYAEFGILHIDAHCDLRPAFDGFVWSHASIMYNVLARVSQVRQLVQVGVRDFSCSEAETVRSSGGRIVTHFDAELAATRFSGVSWADTCAEIIKTLPQDVYVSFDIDGLDPALCPHTGTPVPGGLAFAEASYLIGAVVRSKRRIIGFDLSEIAPGPGEDEWDANVGARILYKLCGWMLRSNGY